MTALVPMGDLEKMATAMATSKLFGIKTKEEAISLMLIAQAEGLHPAIAARDFNVIQGRPALKADAMLARFQREGGVVEWVEYADAKVVGKFSHPKSCPVPVAITWTIEMAKKIGLAGKDNWVKYPRAMLRSRVISEGVRTTFPGVAVGIYTTDEVQDMQREKDITPMAGAGDALSESEITKVDEVVAKVLEWLQQGSLTDAWMEMDNAALEVDAQIYFWKQFDSRIRRQLNEEGERQRIKARPLLENKPISEAQHKRLEAMIAERGLNREALKLKAKDMFGKEHFTEFSTDNYDRFCTFIEDISTNGAPSQSSSASSPPIAERAESPPSTDLPRDYRKEILAADMSSELSNRFQARLKAKVWGASTLEQLSDTSAKNAFEWISAEMDK